MQEGDAGAHQVVSENGTSVLTTVLATIADGRQSSLALEPAASSTGLKYVC
jgi:hypothetical protein